MSHSPSYQAINQANIEHRYSEILDFHNVDAQAQEGVEGAETGS
jgi:hypothetical protein